MDNEYILLLQDFFAGIFDIELDLPKFKIPDVSEGFAWMVKPEGLSSQRIYEKVGEHLNVVPGSWLKICDENLALSCPQVRPQGTYVYSYRDTQSPDEEYLGLSQEEVAKISLSFMLIPEYLLATAFNKFVRNEFFDLYTETILAEYWCYGGIPAGMVYGFHQHRGRNPEGHDREGYDGVCLFNGIPHQKISHAGPRKTNIAQ